MLRNCYSVIRRVIPPIGGKWIPYPAAQVAARRAAQMVVTTVCFSLPPSSANPPGGCNCPPPPPIYPPGFMLVPTPLPRLIPLPVVNTPEPSSLALLAIPLLLLGVIHNRIRKEKTCQRSD